MSKKPSLHALTGIRFFAAIYVVFFHYLDTARYAGPLVDRFVRYGYVGVSLFFVLSGFVLAYNYPAFQAPEDRRRFWWARFARIYPLYFVALLASLPIFFTYTPLDSLLATLKAGVKVGLEAGLLSAWTPWTSCGVNCPGWSLSAEAFFYVLFPLLVPAINRLSSRGLKLLLGLLWLAALLAPLGFALLGPRLGVETRLYVLVRDVVRFTPLFHLPQFLMGAATGLLFARGGANAQPVSWRLRALGLAALAAILVALAALTLDYALVNNGLFAPLFALIIYILARDRGPLVGLLSTRPLVLLGEASYAIYILQYPLAGWFSRLRGGSWMAAKLSPGMLALYTALLVALSIGSFLLWETPMRRRITRWANRAPAPAAPVSVTGE